jgi:hypothetical protein
MFTSNEDIYKLGNREKLEEVLMDAIKKNPAENL